MIEIRALTSEDARRRLAGLSALLVEAVQNGASLEFLATITTGDADDYWAAAIDRVAGDRQVLLVALADDQIVGTVSLILAGQQNQQHRGEISKLLVSPMARRQGVADALMTAVEQEALDRGRTLLVLDTVKGSDASLVYERRGWTRAGDIPDYAYTPAGELVSTSYYWKSLDASSVLAAPGSKI